MAIDNVQQKKHPSKTEYDVMVVGAGSGGISAAIQAARMGAKTLLIEPSGHLGGQLLSVPTMDEGYVEGEGYPIREVGIYAEFIANIRDHYQQQGKSIGTCYWRDDSIAFEPGVAEDVLRQMLEEEPLITVSRNTRVDSVQCEGTVVTGVTTSTGMTLSATIVIDATECGDLLPLTPARYRIGNATNDELAKDACIQDISYPVVVKKYPGEAPQHLIMEHPPPDYDQHRSQFLETVHQNGYNWYKHNCGDDQDQPCWGKYPVNWLTHHAYRGLPASHRPGDYDASSKSAAKITQTLINWANDIPVSISYLEDETQREADNRRAKRKTLAFVYYLQQQLGKEWAVSDNQRFEHPTQDLQLDPAYAEMEKSMPPYPYVRESRRIVPLYTLTGKDIKREGTPPRASKSFPHAVAVGYYPADLHGCNDENTFNHTLEKKTDIPSGFLGGPFQIPYESLIPEEVDGLLAAEKNIGVSRIANGATRLQPITMVVGQVVGTIAALAVNQHSQPRHINPLRLQWVLLNRGQKLSLHFYHDVPRSHALWPVIELVSTRQWMGGTSMDHFGVEDPLTRAEMAQALCRFGGWQIPKSISPSPFRDVKQDNWYAPFVQALNDRVHLPPSRRGRGRFAPHDPVRGAELSLLADLFPLLEDSGQNWRQPWLKLLEQVGAEKTLIPRNREKPIPRGAFAALLAALALSILRAER